MEEIINNPAFGIFLSIIAFHIGLIVSKKLKISIFNPLLIAIFLIILFLKVFNISLKSYQNGGDLIKFFLAPSTVILAIPLYKKIKLLKTHFIPIMMGVFAGVITAILSVVSLSKLLGLNEEIIRSIIPKSITTPIGLGISKSIGGTEAITVVSIVITGITGAVLAPVVCKLFGIKNKIAQGIAIGTASHAVGTSKAVEMGETEGAMSGLAIGLAGLMTVLLMPILIKIIF